jgi:hypothetical protein
VKEKLQNMIKTLGVNATSRVVNGSKNLAKFAFDNKPINFLNLFNDIEPVDSGCGSFILYRYKKNCNLMCVGKSSKLFFVTGDLWSFLINGFDLNITQVQILFKKWLKKQHNIEDLTPVVTMIRYHYDAS